MSLPDIDTTILPWVGKTSKMMGIYFKEKLKQHHINLSREQWVLLKKLNDGDGQTQKDLAFITERNKASLTRLINTMEKKNYLARIPDAKDKRINHIHLTNHGKKTLQASYPAIREAIRELQKGIRDEETKNLIRTLKKIQTNIKREMEIKP